MNKDRDKDVYIPLINMNTIPIPLISLPPSLPSFPSPSLPLYMHAAISIRIGTGTGIRWGVITSSPYCCEVFTGDDVGALLGWGGVGWGGVDMAGLWRWIGWICARAPGGRFDSFS